MSRRLVFFVFSFPNNALLQAQRMLSSCIRFAFVLTLFVFVFVLHRYSLTSIVFSLVEIETSCCSCLSSIVFSSCSCLPSIVFRKFVVDILSVVRMRDTLSSCFGRRAGNQPIRMKRYGYLHFIEIQTGGYFMHKPPSSVEP
jgi:hypothetical protein